MAPKLGSSSATIPLEFNSLLTEHMEHCIASINNPGWKGTTALHLRGRNTNQLFALTCRYVSFDVANLDPQSLSSALNPLPQSSVHELSSQSRSSTLIPLNGSRQPSQAPSIHQAAAVPLSLSSPTPSPARSASSGRTASPTPQPQPGVTLKDVLLLTLGGGLLALDLSALYAGKLSPAAEGLLNTSSLMRFFVLAVGTWGLAPSNAPCAGLCRKASSEATPNPGLNGYYSVVSETRRKVHLTHNAIRRFP